MLGKPQINLAKSQREIDYEFDNFKTPENPSIPAINNFDHENLKSPLRAQFNSSLDFRCFSAFYILEGHSRNHYVTRVFLTRTKKSINDSTNNSYSHVITKF